VNGIAHFWRKNLEEPVICSYHIEGDEHIVFTTGFDYFMGDAHMVEGSLVIMLAEPRTEAIVMDCVEVIDP
jgi:hypothetical protein